MEPIRFGMIGAGAISNAHTAAMEASDDAELVCVADINLEAAQARADERGADRAVDSYDELIAMDDVDAIVIGIPTEFHADAAIKAARAGKHVLCEKPMARTLDDCRAMMEAHEEAGTTLGIGFVRRFDQNWGQIRKMVQEEKAGQPCMWRRIVAGAGPGPPNYGEWYQDSRYSDGPLTESASHDIDFLRYTFGDVASVTAYMEHLSNTGDVLDTNAMILRFESGDTALLQFSWTLPPGATSGFRGMDVIGPEGSIHEPREEDGEWLIDISKTGGEVETIPFVNERCADTWTEGQLNDFIEAIRTGREPRSSGMDGYKAQEIYLAGVESMETGRRIDLPLE
ncbi:MAG: Gfo/Idh/MocA family oxidoreductase [Armatimonadota bacterium]